MQSLGKVVLTARDEYSSTETYNRLDWVTYEGSSFVCMVDGTQGIIPEPGDTWKLLAKRGDSGSGSGDMLQEIYDHNKDGTVDRADAVGNAKTSVLEGLDEDVNGNLTYKDLPIKGGSSIEDITAAEYERRKAAGDLEKDKYYAIVDDTEEGGGGGTTDYSKLTSKPKINDVELNGDMTSADLGLADANVVYTKTEVDNKLEPVNAKLANLDFVALVCTSSTNIGDLRAFLNENKDRTKVKVLNNGDSTPIKNFFGEYGNFLIEIRYLNQYEVVFNSINQWNGNTCNFRWDNLSDADSNYVVNNISNELAKSENIGSYKYFDNITYLAIQALSNTILETTIDYSGKFKIRITNSIGYFRWYVVKIGGVEVFNSGELVEGNVLETQYFNCNQGDSVFISGQANETRVVTNTVTFIREEDTPLTDSINKITEEISTKFRLFSASSKISDITARAYTIGKLCIINGSISAIDTIGGNDDIMLTGLPKPIENQIIPIICQDGKFRRAYIDTAGYLKTFWNADSIPAGTLIMLSSAYPLS